MGILGKGDDCNGMYGAVDVVNYRKIGVPKDAWAWMELKLSEQGKTMDRQTLEKMAMIPELESDTAGIRIDPNANESTIKIMSSYERDIEKLREHCLSLVNDHAESSRILSKQVLDLQKTVDTQLNQLTDLANKLATSEQTRKDTKLKLDIEIERYNDLIDKVLKQKEYR